jgi:hypothetical protein
VLEKPDDLYIYVFYGVNGSRAYASVKIRRAKSMIEIQKFISPELVEKAVMRVFLETYKSTARKLYGLMLLGSQSFFILPNNNANNNANYIYDSHTRHMQMIYEIARDNDLYRSMKKSLYLAYEVCLVALGLDEQKDLFLVEFRRALHDKGVLSNAEFVRLYKRHADYDIISNNRSLLDKAHFTLCMQTFALHQQLFTERVVRTHFNFYECPEFVNLVHALRTEIPLGPRGIIHSFL